MATKCVMLEYIPESPHALPKFSSVLTDVYSTCKKDQSFFHRLVLPSQPLLLIGHDSLKGEQWSHILRSQTDEIFQFQPYGSTSNLKTLKIQ